MKTIATFILCLLTSAGVHAATIHADATTCTLADAIVATNTDTAAGGCPPGAPGADTIVLDADLTLMAADPSSTLHNGLGAGLPDVTDDLTISAGLGRVIRRDPTFTCEAATADPVFRFINLESGSLTLENLTFENGCFVAAGGNNQGGGIRAATSTDLTLTGVVVRHFGAWTTSGSLEGGFLYTEGDRLTVTDGRFETLRVDVADSLQGGVLNIEDDVIASIRDTHFSNIDAVSVNSSLQGGVIYMRGVLTLEDTTFELVDVETPSSLQGGVLYASSVGALFVRHSSFRQFTGRTTFGAGVQGGAYYATVNTQILTDVVFSDIEISSSGGCNGGALYSTQNGPFEGLVVERVRCTTDGSIDGNGAYFFGSATILRDCLFRDNEGLAVAGARGGALFGNRFERIERCAFLNNRLKPAVSLVATDLEGGGLSVGEIGLLRNVTIAGNALEGGSGVAPGQDGGSALGGGLYLESNSATSRLAAVTLANNQAIGGEGADGFLDGLALGGGLYVDSGHTVEVLGSILSGNSATDRTGLTFDQDCFAEGTLDSLGFNIVENADPSCPMTAFGDVTGIDPELYPVADYGCAAPLPGGSCVPTAAIDQTSWAVDWGSCADFGLGEDARGLVRRQDIAGVPNLAADACDVGAFEARDRDGDGITDVPDLCPDDADSDQSDRDGDQVGDACDACAGDDASGDTDSDRVCDDLDVCNGFDDGLDADDDTVPDGCDVCVGNDASGDADGDLVCDDSDICAGFDDGLDADGDGVPDGCDACLGDDATADSDGDGVCDDSDASVGDRVWLDDGNGIQDGGEPGVVGVTVHLFSSDATLVDSAVTDADGEYFFSPGPGDFYIEIVLPIDMAYAPRDQGTDDRVDSDVNAGSGTTSVFTLTAGPFDESRDAGLEPAVIGNRVWLDIDGDGRQEVGEVGLGGVTVRLLDADGSEVATTTTRPDGSYGFLGLATGQYRIEVVLPEGHVFSLADTGGDDHLDSDIDPATGLGPVFSYTTSSANQRWDAGLRTAPLFEDGFESREFSAWTGRVP